MSKAVSSQTNDHFCAHMSFISEDVPSIIFSYLGLAAGYLVHLNFDNLKSENFLSVEKSIHICLAPLCTYNIVWYDMREWHTSKK